MMAKILDFPFFLCLADVVLDNDTLQWLCSPARKCSAIAQSLISADPRPFSDLATQTNRCLRWKKPQAVQYPFKRGGTQKYPNATPIVLGHFHYRSASSCQKQRSLLIYIYIYTRIPQAANNIHKQYVNPYRKIKTLTVHGRVLTGRMHECSRSNYRLSNLPLKWGSCPCAMCQRQCLCQTFPKLRITLWFLWCFA